MFLDESQVVLVDQRSATRRADYAYCNWNKHEASYGCRIADELHQIAIQHPVEQIADQFICYCDRNKCFLFNWELKYRFPA